MSFDAENIRALCFRDKHLDEARRFDKLLRDLSFHRACDDGSERQLASAKLMECRKFLLDHEWHYDHIHYFFDQGNGSYLVTPDEFYRWLISKMYRMYQKEIEAC